jgi:hypothetical protein
VLLASVLIPVCIPFWAIIWFTIYQSVKKGGSAIMLAGAAGEDLALAHLSRLPDEYTVFNQICLPDSRSRTGYREADFVVVGPNGVFIIENKCNHHLLHDSKTWFVMFFCYGQLRHIMSHLLCTIHGESGRKEFAMKINSMRTDMECFNWFKTILAT